MIRIGEFSKICKITVKTLRYYDKVDILKPSYINPNNGYRYYEIAQINKMILIQNLKTMGFRLDEISFIIKSSLNMNQIADLLERKKDEVEKNILLEKTKLLKLNNFIKKLEEGNIMENVKIKTLPKVIVASMRLIIKNYNELYRIAPEMGKKMESHGAVCQEPFYCFNIYHDKEYKEENIDIEICESVVKKLENRDGIEYKIVDQVKKAACIEHKGPYENLIESYKKILEWIEENGYEIAGNERESYIDGCWNKNDPKDWLTEIQIPIK